MSPPIARRARGASLVELTVVLVVIGLVTLVLLRFLQVAARDREDVASHALLQRADDALLAFAMVNARLPCPASGTDGIEDCAAGQVGRLPYRTIGLPDANARHMRYGVLRRPASRKQDADLTQRLDRFDPLQVVGGGVGTELPVGHRNGLDLCWALRSADNAPANPSFLHVARPDAASALGAHVAYALALPAPGEAFGGHQATTNPVFDSPRRTASPFHRDRVLAVGLDQLWTRMRCGDNLAAASHAHFNSAAAITVMHTALVDYKSQLAISDKLAQANVENGAAAVLAGTAGVAGAAGDVADTVSEGLASTGIVSYRIALGAVATAAAVAVTITAAALVAAADQSKDAASDAYRDVDPHITAAAALESNVLEHARAADAVGLY